MTSSQVAVPAAGEGGWPGTRSAPAGRVMVDPARLQGFAAAVRAAAETLRGGARVLLRALTPTGLRTASVDQLARLGAAFDAEATALTRRAAAAAERVDAALPRAPLRAGVLLALAAAPGPALPAPAGADPGGDRWRDRDSPQWTAGQAAAVLLVRGAGGGSGQHASGATTGGGGHVDPRSGRRLAASGDGDRGAGAATSPPGPADPGGAPEVALRALRAQAEEPRFVAGFFDTLGPAGLARLLAALGGPGGALGHQGATPVLRVDRRAASAVLGKAFAAYSRTQVLDDGWLGRFNLRDRDDRVDAVLLAPLLGAGRLSVALLDRLARLAFGPGTEPAPSSPPAEPGLQPGGADPQPGSGRAVPGDIRLDRGGGGPRGAAAGRGFEGALLDAIGAEPALVARVAGRHLDDVLGVGGLASLGLPVPVGPDSATQDAWARLVATAGGPHARTADPRASAAFAARLARSVEAAGGSRLPPRLRAAFVSTLHTYRDEIYDTVTAVAPGRIDPADPADVLREVPVEAWRALLRESLRGGVLTGLLARDAAAYAVGLEQRQAERTRGWNASSGGGYPASPRALAYLRAAGAQACFAGALSDAAEAVIADHAEDGAAFRRRQDHVLNLLGAVATAIDPTNPAATFARLGVGVTVEELDALVRSRYRDISTAQPRRVLAELREAARARPEWAGAYEESARLLWERHISDPLRSVTVVGVDGQPRVYCGDPHADGFITGPATNFLDTAGRPRQAASLTPAQRRAYLDWLQSPALVANNDRMPFLAGPAGSGDVRVPPDRVLRPGG